MTSPPPPPPPGWIRVQVLEGSSLHRGPLPQAWHLLLVPCLPLHLNGLSAAVAIDRDLISPIAVPVDKHCLCLVQLDTLCWLLVSTALSTKMYCYLCWNAGETQYECLLTHHKAACNLWTSRNLVGIFSIIVSASSSSVMVSESSSSVVMSESSCASTCIGRLSLFVKALWLSSPS